MKGKIVLVPFPFTDLTASKYRPALVLYEGRNDLVVAFISSKVPINLSEADVLIAEKHEEFRKTGLKVSSVIKHDKTATILKSLVIGELGEVSPFLREEINGKLRKLYKL
jgi:mRNA interferase MazF